MVQVSNLGGGQDFLQPSRGSLGPNQPPVQGYRVSFPGIKWLGHSTDHPPPSSAEVKERVELFYSLRRPWWRLLGLTLALLLPLPGGIKYTYVILFFTIKYSPRRSSFFNCLILEDETDRLSQNVSKKLPFYTA
jgi:hypothetical protein